MLFELSRLMEEFSNLVRTVEIHIFTLFIALDVITGFVKGAMKKEANSTKGLMGVIKHLLVLLLVYTAYPYLVLLDAKAIATSFVLFFIASYGISIAENWGQIGLPMPKQVVVYFQKLKRDHDDNGGTL